MFTLEYADGYYIAKDDEGVIDLAEPENREFAEFVVNALNAAQQPYALDGATGAAKERDQRNEFLRKCFPSPYPPRK